MSGYGFIISELAQPISNYKTFFFYFYFFFFSFTYAHNHVSDEAWNSSRMNT